MNYETIKNRFTGEIMCGGLSLKVVLEKHQKWLNDEEGGDRASLDGASLDRASLVGANLDGASLVGASLDGASLDRASLVGASLVGASLVGANLDGANLDGIKTDFFARLDLAKDEVASLYDHLMRGKIDGSAYQGECACFCGTIANIRGEDYRAMKIDLRPDSSCPTERWFMAIGEGDTPDSNQVARITAGWLREFMAQHEIRFPEYRLVSSFEYPQAFEKAAA